MPRLVQQFGEPAHQPVALVTLTRPVAGTVRISMLYTPQERRRSGQAPAGLRAPWEGRKHGHARCYLPATGYDD